METKKTLETTSTDNVVISRAQYEELVAKSRQAEFYQTEVARLEHLLQLLRAKKYGPKSEKLPSTEMVELIRLFDEAEATQFAQEEEAKAEEQEPETITVKEHKRAKRPKKNILDSLPEGTEVQTEEHYLTEDGTQCPKCGSDLEIVGKKEVKRLIIEPAKYTLKVDIYYVYACKNCPDNGNNVTFLEPKRVPSVIPGSPASPEAIAYIALQKFVMGAPLYRQEQDFMRQGLELSRQTMSNWLLYSAEHWLKPLYQKMHELLLEEEILHADETTVQVLQEPGRSPQSKSYMWVYRTGACSKRSLVLYKYEPGRRKEFAEDFLQGFKGYLHTDGYEAYHSLGQDIVNVGCLAHARRYFHDALKASKGNMNQTAAKAMGYFTQIFKWEKALASLDPEERYQQRLEKEKPVLDALFAWAEKLNVMPRSILGKAFGYLLHQKKYLYNYLLDGRLEATNNKAERSIKPFVISRKNFLFANTPKGADGSSIFFSMIETAKENQLDPYRYLVHVLTMAPILNEEGENWAEKLLPENAPEQCKTNYKGK